MGYDAGDDHGQSKEGPQKHDDEGADGGEEKSVSGSIGSDGKQNRQSSAGWTQGVLYCLLNTAKDRPERRSFLHGRSEVIRTPGILLPNLSGKLFLLIYSGFKLFSVCFTYSLTLLSPLFPGVPAPSVVIYVVKNASRPVSGECSPTPDGKRFSLLLAAL